MGDMIELVAEEAMTTGACRLEWYVIQNIYFREGDAIQMVKDWAEANGYHASFDYEVWSPTSAKVRAVTFRPKNPAT